MARTQLIDQFKIEVSKYIGIPYWRNKLKNGKIIKEGPGGGKATCQQIAIETIKAAKKQQIDLTQLSNQEFYNFQKKNNIGIDCSGLAYNLLDSYSQILHKTGICEIVVGTENKTGARRVSANLLTSPINSIPISNYNNIKAGDLIRMNEGKHVVLIIEKNGDIIDYVNSSEFTKIRGVHYGQIKLINPNKTLNYQKWSDQTLSGKEYNTLIFPKKGDGIFRLKCLEK